MRINLVDSNIVNLYNIPKIDNPVHFNRGGGATSDGLLSHEIFGRPGSMERSSIFGYVDLKARFMHPVAYKAFSRVNRNINKIISGETKYKIVAGELIEDENGETGIEFLYKNWEKIKFEKSDSIQRNNRIDLMELNKNLLFQQIQLVIPPFYRDIDLESKTHDLVNDLYAKLLRLVRALELIGGSEGIGNIGDGTRMNIQKCLLDIYEYFSSKIKGKDGLFHQTVLGKSVDNCARLVITAPNYDCDNYKDALVSYDTCGIPLAQVCVLFFPFIVSKLEKYFVEHFSYHNTIKILEKNGTISDVPIASDGLADFSYDKLVERITKFKKSPTERFDIIKIKTEEGYVPLTFFGSRQNLQTGERDITPADKFTRHITWTDVLFQVACDVVKDKHVLITRYPLIDYMGIFINKINVLSTQKTSNVTVNGIEYKFYPDIDLNVAPDDMYGIFYDSLQFSNLYLTATGGDYDGDQVTVRGMYTQEANDEAERILYSQKHLFNIMGSSIRDVTKDAVHGIHAFTKRV